MGGCHCVEGCGLTGGLFIFIENGANTSSSAAAAMWLQSCPILCDPIDHSPPGSSVHGILQARMLEWLPFPPPGDLPNPGIELMSLTPPALADGFFTIWEAPKDTQAPFLLSGFLNSSPTCFSSCLSRPAVMISRSALLSLCQW